MTGVVCPNCNESFDSDKRLARADVTECKSCQQKFVVTKQTLDAYKDAQQAQVIAPTQSAAPQHSLPVKISCPHCATVLQGDIAIGQIVGCSECHKQFEATAERLNHLPSVLPKAPEPTPTPQKPKSIAGRLFMIAVGLIITFAYFAPDSSNNTTEIQAKAPPTTEPVPFKDPGDPKNFLHYYDGSNKELVALVKSGMNNPKSFEHVETRFIDKGDSLKLFMTFRGTNGFNAVVTNNVSADLDKSTRTLSNVQ